MELAAIIQQHIRTNGPISFREYMEMALYYPNLGYYMSDHQCIGRTGDFFTSSSLGPVFGAMIARQLEEMWRHLDVEDFTVVEYGAGTGALCADILQYFRKYTNHLPKLHYVIIEKSPAMRERERLNLPEDVRWCRGLHEVGEFTGCVLSNELVDNFAVHQVIMRQELMEIFIDDNFGEIMRPAGKEINAYFADLNVRLPEGFRTEVNLEAISWLAEIARCLKAGYVITVDYGYEAAELYKGYRSRGTLLCYRGHEVNEKYCDHIGRQDITAHVNFSALRHWGALHGLSCVGLTSQAAFLLALDFKDFLRKESAPDADVLQLAMQEVRLTRTLLIDMGMKFKVLIQGKQVPGHELTGLQH